MSSRIPERDDQIVAGSDSPDALLSEWWTSFKESHDTQAREHLILHFAPLVKFVAGRVGGKLPPNVETADLMSYGLFGLIDAIEKFEPERGIKFESYAMTRIRGAIIDELRALDWIPRSVRTKARAIEQAYAAFESREHRSPTDDELARELEMTPEELQETFSQLANISVIALDDLLGEEGLSFAEVLADAGAEDPAQTAEAHAAKELLTHAIDQLPNREKLVIQSYYFDGMTLSQIGKVLKVTESRISQMHSKAVLHLRGLLREWR